MSPGHDDRSKGPAVPEPGPGDSPDRTEAGLTGGGIPEPVNGSGGSPTRVGRQRPCPNCGSRSVAAIHYGMPMGDWRHDPGLDTEFVLGGCCIWPEMPLYRCHECGYEWAHAGSDDDK